VLALLRGVLAVMLLVGNARGSRMRLYVRLRLLTLVLLGVVQDPRSSRRIGARG
jgi:hypothetical protein